MVNRVPTATRAVTLPGERPRCASGRKGSGVYTKPTLERFGTLRDLTLVGVLGASDGGLLGGGLPDPPSTGS